MAKQIKTEQQIQPASFNREQVELIKQTVARGATDVELSLFLYTARRTGLDPLTKQIHAIKRWDSAAGKETMAIQTGIDGYRLIADRTGKLAGIDDAVFDREDRTNPEKATVTVYKIINGEKCPFTASARWSEYCAFKKDGTPMALWKKMPYLMLGKCAEALALRKAFPADLTGIYTFEEEMAVDGAVPEQLPVGTPVIEKVVVTGAVAGGLGPPEKQKPAQPAQPERHPQQLPVGQPEQPKPKPAKKAASKQGTLSVEDSPSSPQSNYTRLLEFLHSGGYTGDQFMKVAHRNRWIKKDAEKLSDVSDNDLAEFVKIENAPIIAEQLDKLQKE